MWIECFALCLFVRFVLFPTISLALGTLSGTRQTVEKYMLGSVISLSATPHQNLLVDMSVFSTRQGLANFFCKSPVSKYFAFRPHNLCCNSSILSLKHEKQSDNM